MASNNNKIIKFFNYLLIKLSELDNIFFTLLLFSSQLSEASFHPHMLKIIYQTDVFRMNNF